MEFIFCNKKITKKELEENRWLQYLYLTKENRVNLERVSTVEELAYDNHVLHYVERTLMILKTHTELSDEEMEYVQETLKWSEVSKCAMPEQRGKWQMQGFNLEIHNEASAQIYELEMKEQGKSDSDRKHEIVRMLIDTHGLLGQYIRGENNFDVHKPLAKLVQDGLICSESLKRVLFALNHAVIAGVDVKLWERLEDEVVHLIELIVNNQFQMETMSVHERLKRLFRAFRHSNELSTAEEKLYTDILSCNDIWYAQSALDTFSRKEINTIFECISKQAVKSKHISFYRLSKTLNYDYEGHRKINVYKKRIVEMCLRELAENVEDPKSKEHVSVEMELVGDTLYFDVCFTRVCDSLIQFCVEAERSQIMTYEKSIQTIFDLFGFRRDIFDRLNNEEKYLETMNNAEASTKLQIMDYITGNCILDVGSGGGVLLDVLEKTYPDKHIIGTDISANVIEALNQKIENEGHHYQVRKHNFVEGPIDISVDTILFSSILHEVYSYTEWNGEKFCIDAVKIALKNAYDSLPKGGRIIIRDGVMASSNATGKVRFLKEDGVSFANNYIRDFKGLKFLQDETGARQWRAEKVNLEGNVLHADVNFIREALYTYTWGSESYAQEVLEQFGYFTYQEYVDFLKELGMEIVFADSFTETGYPEHLNPLVELLDGLSWDDLPSTCIIAAQK